MPQGLERALSWWYWHGDASVLHRHVLGVLLISGKGALIPFAMLLTKETVWTIWVVKENQKWVYCPALSGGDQAQGSWHLYTQRTSLKTCLPCQFPSKNQWEYKYYLVPVLLHPCSNLVLLRCVPGIANSIIQKFCSTPIHYLWSLVIPLIHSP